MDPFGTLFFNTQVSSIYIVSPNDELNLQQPPQNAGNHISEDVTFKMSQAGMPPNPLDTSAFARRLFEPPFSKS